MGPYRLALTPSNLMPLECRAIATQHTATLKWLPLATESLPMNLPGKAQSVAGIPRIHEPIPPPRAFESSRYTAIAQNCRCKLLPKHDMIRRTWIGYYRESVFYPAHFQGSVMVPLNRLLQKTGLSNDGWDKNCKSPELIFNEDYTFADE